MNIKRNLAAILALTIAFSSQLSLSANAQENYTAGGEVTSDAPKNTEAHKAAEGMLPRVELEYKGVEVTDASREVLTLSDGKKLYIASGEKRSYNGMYVKGNKLDISGKFAYNEKQDLYLHVDASIELSLPEADEDSPELAAKIASLPQTRMDGGFFDILKATDDILYLSNGMKMYVSSGKQHYTGVFKEGNAYCFEGTFAYDKDEDMYYNVDSEMYLVNYCGNFCVAGWEEQDEDGNWIEVTETTTTTYVEDITTATTTTTAYQPQERIISEKSQPENKYPVKYFDFVYYWINKEVTVKEIDMFDIVAEDGTRWSFYGDGIDPYKLGRGDVIKFEGFFWYSPDNDKFGARECKYELVSESNDYEKYATIEIKNDFPHVIMDKRLAADHNIQYEVDLDDVEIINIKTLEDNDAVLTVEGGYDFIYSSSCDGCGILSKGDHISVKGRFEYHDYDEYGKWFAPTNYQIDESMQGKYAVVSKAGETPKAERKTAPGKKGDANVDNGVDLADVVFIMQTMANPNKYQLTSEGRENADVSGTGNGVTLEDASAIQIGLLNGEYR